MQELESFEGKIEVNQEFMSTPSPTIQVLFYYHIEDAEGNILLTNDGFDPDHYTLGSGGMAKGLEEVLTSMAVGEKKEFVLSQEQGYGPSNPELFFELPLGLFGFTGDMEIGEFIQLPNGMEGIVVEKTETHLVADANAPMAGKELHCVFELLERKEIQEEDGPGCGPGCSC